MKISKSQKICGGLFAAAVIALATDRLTASASDPDASGDYAVGAPAASSTTRLPITPPKARDAASPARSAAATPEAALAARLREQVARLPEDRRLVRDVFAEGTSPGDRLSPEASADNAPDLHGWERRTLDGLLVRPDGGVAIVDGQAVRVGESLGGLRLVRVANGAATFAGGGRKVTLRLGAPPRMDATR